MQSLNNIFLVALASIRLTSLLNHEDGPFDIFKRFRMFIGIKEEIKVEIDEVGIERIEIKKYAETFWAQLVNCPYCLSGWVTLLLMLKVFRPLVVWLAIWGLVQIYLDWEHNSSSDSF